MNEFHSDEHPFPATRYDSRSIWKTAVYRAVLGLLTQHYDVSRFLGQLGGAPDLDDVREALAAVVANARELSGVAHDAAVLLGIKVPDPTPYDEVHALGRSGFARATHPTAAITLALSLHREEFRTTGFLGIGSGPRARDEIHVARLHGIPATAVDPSPVAVEGARQRTRELGLEHLVSVHGSLDEVRGSFGTSASTSVDHLVEDLRSLMQRRHGFIDDGGLLVVAVKALEDTTPVSGRPAIRAPGRTCLYGIVRYERPIEAYIASMQGLFTLIDVRNVEEEYDERGTQRFHVIFARKVGEP